MASSENKGFVSEPQKVREMMDEIAERCKSIADIAIKGSNLDYVLQNERNNSWTIRSQLFSLVSDIRQRSLELIHYDVIQIGKAHVQGDTVECIGEVMTWEQFCAVRDTNGVISFTDDIVDIGEHKLTLDQYLAARDAHQRN